MRIGIHNFHEQYNQKNALFDPVAYQIGENMEHGATELRSYFAQRGHSLDTLDIHPADSYNAVLFLDMPRFEDYNRIRSACPSAEMFLLIFECEVVRPENFDLALQSRFELVFTWNPRLTDGKKTIQYYWPQKINPKVMTYRGSREGLVVVIAGNKKSTDPRGLYSKRIEIIRWFEKVHPGRLDLYGIGWDKFTFTGPKLVRGLNRVPLLGRLLAHKYAGYKGPVSSKRATLEKYRFSICLENARTTPGYITEKIFDCFFAGCVPIYFGAIDIADHIPSNCFIPLDQFASLSDLYEYLTKMSEAEFGMYQDNIQAFLAGEKAERFSGESFARTVGGAISNCLEASS